jgi:hypothetical protein
MFIPEPGSRILIFTHPGSRISDPESRIPDPKTATKETGEKKFFCHNFLCSHKFHKIANYFSFEVLKKKIWANFQRIIELFTQKVVTKLSKIWVWDQGSEIRDPGKTYPGSRGQKGTGSRIRIRNTVLNFHFCKRYGYKKVGQKKVSVSFCSCWIRDPRSGMEENQDPG